jgi:Uma2 family endonuclease
MLQTLRKPPRRRVRIGPNDHGQHMSLDVFDRAIAEEGYTYELSKGVVEVSGIPKPKHGLQVQAIRNQLAHYQDTHAGVIHYLAGGSDAKMLIGSQQSERHADVSAYLTPPPVEGDEAWSLWVPGIVIEVVSESSRKRDYEEKPGEYLEFGVDEYWIVDGVKQRFTVLSRWRGQWKKRMVKQKYRTPLLPGFALDLKKVLAAGK